jgi:hypothetical protein
VHCWPAISKTKPLGTAKKGRFHRRLSLVEAFAQNAFPVKFIHSYRFPKQTYSIKVHEAASGLYIQFQGKYALVMARFYFKAEVLPMDLKY